MFTERGAHWVHNPHHDAPIITTKIRNKNIHRMLIDTESAADILYLSAFNRMGLLQEYLRPATTPFYGFTGDSMVLQGKISLPMTVREHPRVLTVIMNFLVVDCPSAYNTVIG